MESLCDPLYVRTGCQRVEVKEVHLTVRHRDTIPGGGVKVVVGWWGGEVAGQWDGGRAVGWWQGSGMVGWWDDGVFGARWGKVR